MRQPWQRIFFILLAVTVFVTVSLGEDQISLQIQPAGSRQLKAISENLLLTCIAQVPNPDLITDLQWLGPDNNPIPKSDRKYSERSSTNKNMLFIKNIQQEDAGIYRCSAKYAESQELHSDVQLETFMDITWEDAPIEQHVIINTEARIKCSVKANPPPTVDWLKDGEKFISNDRCIVNTDGILCQQILPQDEGQYTCRARVSETGNVAERLIRVEVDTPPKIDSLLSEYNTIEDKPLTMSCSATGKPIPTIVWVNKENVDLSKIPGYIVDERTGELKIEKVSLDDSGAFKCIAKSSAGEDSKETKVTVVSKPKIKKFESITAEKSKKAQLICRVQAEPPANIIIRKKDSSRIYENNQQYEDRIIVEMINEGNDQLLTVTIKETRDDDDGTYQCEADNIGGKVIAEAHVTVEHAPVFDELSLKPMKSWEHHIVNLTCIAKSIPNATIEWYTLSRDISHDPNILIFNNGPFSTLQVKTTGNTYYIEYRCKATNKLGTRELPFKIEQAFPPKEIKQADFKTITATTATFLIVGPDDDGGMPLTHYTVEYTDDDTGETKRRQWPAAGSQTFILDKLEPEKKYTFKFAASNAVGDGPFTQKRTKVTKKVNSPEEPQIIATSNIRPLQSPYPDRVTIQWKIPEDNGAAIQYFDITYIPVDNDGVLIPMENGNAPTKASPTSTQIELINLHPNTVYKVEVRAYNRVGYSSPGQITIKTAQGTTTDQQQLQAASFPLEVIIIIVVVVFVLLLIVIDVSCYFMNNCGLLMCLCVHICGKEQLSEKEKDGIMETGKSRDKEKEALKDSLDNDIRNKSPIGSRSSIAKDSPV